MKKSITEFTPWLSEMEQVLRQGAREYLQWVLEDEAQRYVDEFSSLVNGKGHRKVKRNGYMPERKLVTSLGSIKVKQPRVRDERKDQQFNSNILPPYIRKAPSIENLIPILYLKGLSTSDFAVALESILGPNYKGLSAKTVERLKQKWMDDFNSWNKRDLSGKKFTYVWADGIYFKVRLADPEDKKICFLVIIGATSDGKKELIGVLDGYRESKDSWQFLLGQLKSKGMNDPKLAIADGALGFWAAVQEMWPETKTQRCWVHKTANVLNKLPKSLQARAKAMLHDVYRAETEKEARKAFQLFLHLFGDKYPGACKCLKKDEDSLFGFFNFPAVHWQHIRSTNVIESTFATVRLRTKRTKGSGSRNATLMMVFKLCLEASKGWRRLQGYQKLQQVENNVEFIDGYTEEEWAEMKLAA